MSSRKLSDQQARRVRTMHARRSRNDDTASSGDTSGIEGLVIARLGKRVDVEDPLHPGELQRCHIRSNIGSLVAGDRIIWQRTEDGGVVVARRDRSSVLERPDVQGIPRAAAANLDQIIIVIAPEPTPHANLLDRYLVAAENARLNAVIVLNKTDLADRFSGIDEMLGLYTAIGYQVLRASALQTGGMAALRQALAAHVTAFVGQSGVGKSSLISALLPEEEIRIGELSAGVSKGRHTTTGARLYHLPDGGDLIDSPGIREFSLSHLDASSTAWGFIEFHPFLGRCRFRDCDHRDEPGCAVREAVMEGHIRPERYASYLQITGEKP